MTIVRMPKRSATTPQQRGRDNSTCESPPEPVRERVHMRKLQVRGRPRNNKNGKTRGKKHCIKTKTG